MPSIEEQEADLLPKNEPLDDNAICEALKKRQNRLTHCILSLTLEEFERFHPHIVLGAE